MGRRALLALTVGAALLLLAGGSGTHARAATDATVPAAELPDLVPEPPPYAELAPTYTASDPLGLVYLDPPASPYLLRFTTVAGNHGGVPLEISGTPSAEPLMLSAAQCTAWTGQVCRQRQDVGDMIWHEPHRHWHFDDFALYELRRLLPGGVPDMSAAGLVGTGRKASFCLEDSQRANAEGAPVTPYRTCSGVFQGISAGWADVYDSSLPGQELPLDGVGDGRYALVVTLDPANRLRESDETNNVASCVIELADGATRVTIVP